MGHFTECLESRRLFAAGQPDLSWGNGQVAAIDVPGDTADEPWSATHILAVANGHVYLQLERDGGPDLTDQRVIARLTRSGKLDTSFGQNDVVSLNLPQFGLGFLAIDPATERMALLVPNASGQSTTIRV